MTRVYVIGALWLPASYTITQYCPDAIVPASCGVGLACVTVDPPVSNWHAVPT